MRWLAILLSLWPLAAAAQAENSYLVFPSLAAAQAFSTARCRALGCSIPWWPVIPNADGTAAVVLEPSVRADGQDFTVAAVPVGQRPPCAAVAAAGCLATEAQATAAGFPTPTWAAQRVPGSAKAAVKAQ